MSENLFLIKITVHDSLFCVESLFTKIYKMAVFYVHQKMTSKFELKIVSMRGPHECLNTFHMIFMHRFLRFANLSSL